MERVEGLLPRGVELFVKREDRASTVYGGNKVRKLEYLLAEARARGADRVVTLGGWGSHHALATAIYARELGFSCALHLFPQPRTAHVDEQLAADRAAGAEVHEHGSLVSALASLAVDRLRPRTYYIAAGGSSVTGSLGWVRAASELPKVDAMWIALGSCGTVAGLWAGLDGAENEPGELVGVRVVEKPVSGYAPTRKLAEAVRERMGVGALRSLSLRVIDDQIGAGYGVATDAANEAVAIAASHGMTLEPTYTGKALAALLAEAKTGALDGKRVLFINTYAGRERR